MEAQSHLIVWRTTKESLVQLQQRTGDRVSVEEAQEPGSERPFVHFSEFELPP